VYSGAGNASAKPINRTAVQYFWHLSVQLSEGVIF